MSTRTIKDFREYQSKRTKKPKVHISEVLTREKRARIKAIMVLQRQGHADWMHTKEYRKEIMALASVLQTLQGAMYARKVAEAYVAWRDI
jgi:hypothetical protein